jgi:hypothetical protein
VIRAELTEQAPTMDLAQFSVGFSFQKVFAPPAWFAAIDANFRTYRTQQNSLNIHRQFGRFVFAKVLRDTV